MARIKKPSVEQVLLYRAQNECGMQQAKRELFLVATKQAIRDAATLDELKEVLLEMMELSLRD